MHIYPADTHLDKFSKKATKSGPIAILCGSGISVSAGLPSAWPFMGKLLDKVNGSGKWKFSEHLKAGLPERVPLRFEGLLEVLQRTVDEQLDILEECYFPKGCKPNDLHQYLAILSRAHPVVTTNFDVLIEKKLSCHDRSSLVHVLQKDWQKSTRVPNNGLWKIHGTIKVYDSNTYTWEVPPDDARPVGTLHLVSRSRHDSARESVFRRILCQYSLVILGYSGADDFDVSEWLRRARGPIFWIAFDGKASVPKSLRNAWDANSVEVHVLDAKKKQKYIARVLASLCGRRLPACKAGSWHETPTRKWAAKRMRNKLVRQIVTAELLKHLSRYKEASELLRDLDTKIASKKNRAISFLLLAESELHLPDKESWNAASHQAKQAQKLFRQLGRTNEFCRAKIAEAVAYRLLRDKAKMKEAEKLLKWVLGCSKVEFEKARAVAELTRLDRHRKLTAIRNLGKLQKCWGIGDLDVEALTRHEKSYKVRCNAKTSRAFYKARDEMVAAVRLRKDLGDIDGYASSLNQLGNLYHRYADFLGWEKSKLLPDKSEDAEEAHKESVKIAKNFGLQWHEDQARIALAVYYLRCCRDRLRATKQIKRVRGPDKVGYAPVEAQMLQFVRDLLDISGERNLLEAASLGKSRFETLVDCLKSHSEDTQRRLYEAATFNLEACKWLLSGSKGSVPRLRDAAETPYWRKRVSTLRSALRHGLLRTADHLACSLERPPSIRQS